MLQKYDSIISSHYYANKTKQKFKTNSKTKIIKEKKRKMQALKDKNLLNLYVKELEEEKDILSFCQSNKYLYEQFCTDNYLQSFMQKRYPGIERYKKEGENWKQYFLRVVYYKAKLQEDYNFKYEGGNIEAQYKLLNKYLQNSSTNKKLDELLMKAADNNSFPLVKYALRNGAHINGVTGSDWSERPITRAILNENLDMVKYFIDNGANVQYATGYMTETSLEIFKYLYEHILNTYPIIVDDSFKNGKLESAAEDGKYEIVEYLLNKGANVHANNSSALVKAAERGKIKVVRLLLDRGADIHANNDEALRLAAKGGHLQVVKRLLQYGANPLIFTEAELSKLNPMISEIIYKSKF